VWGVEQALDKTVLLMARKRAKPKQEIRKDHEPPLAIAHNGWRYHHVGIPTSTPRPDERHLSHLKISVSGFETSPYGVEWMRFEPGCQIAELIKTVPHVAFEVDDLDTAIAGRTLLGEISSPSDGVRVAMFVDDGVPIELLEFRKSAATERSRARDNDRRERGEAVKPLIGGTVFGSITIAGKVYKHDVVIRLSGKVKKRKKRLSKKKYRTSHKVSLEEAEHIFQAGAERLIVGTGQSGWLALSDEASEFFRRNGCSIVQLPTPEAVTAWNAAKGGAIGMFHVTC
jgi:hypothetical protein